MPLPLVRARAERLPLADESFDIVLSDYGATTFSDPYCTIPEATRVLRPGGILVFAHASPFRTLTEAPRANRLRRRLLRDYFGLHEVRIGTEREFQLTYAEWVRLFTSSGLVLERLVEPPAPRSRGSTYVARANLPWARRWPMESIWRLRKATSSADRQGRRSALGTEHASRRHGRAASGDPRRPRASEGTL